MKYLIVYHKEDNDGVFSGAIFYHYLSNVLKKNNEENMDIDILPSDYIDMKQFENTWNNVSELHNVYSDIILVDISFSTEYMIRLYNEFDNRFIWCDHHAPIIRSLKGYNDLICGIRNTKKSAILCAYEFLYDPLNNEEIPEIFRILSAWDSFAFKEKGYTLEYVRNINKAINLQYKLNFNDILNFIEFIFDDTIKPDLSYLYDYGKQFNDYDQENIDNIIKTSGDISWELDNHDKACAIFHQGPSNSLMFKTLKDTNIQHGIVFKHNKNSTWTISLYNINEEDTFHCGEYLRNKYGGGGHVGAAGCQISQEQFIKILTNKII